MFIHFVNSYLNSRIIRPWIKSDCEEYSTHIKRYILTCLYHLLPSYSDRTIKQFCQTMWLACVKLRFSIVCLYICLVFLFISLYLVIHLSGYGSITDFWYASFPPDFLFSLHVLFTKWYALITSENYEKYNKRKCTRGIKSIKPVY